MTTDQDFDLEVRRNYRHNFIVNVMDGTTFWFAYSFIAPSTILPLYVSHFTRDNFLIGLIPTLSTACYLIPQLFTANFVSRLPVKKVLPVKIGLFTERLPVFLLAPSALFLANRSPTLALLAFFVLFSWHTLGAGLVAVGWQDMIAKVIPIDRRGVFYGLTNFGGTFTGVLGATAVAWVLARFVFPIGYVFAFGTAAIFIFISWISISLTREPPVVSHVKTVSQIQYLRSLPDILSRDNNFRRYISSQIVLNLGGMGIGFLAVYAARRWQVPDSQAGTYTAVMLIGGAAANLAFGALADRKGHKLVLEISALLGILSFVLAGMVTTPDWFYAVFALRGASFAGGMLSSMMITLEFSAPELRPTYIGLCNTISGIAGSVAPLVGSGLADITGYQWLFWASAVIGLVGFALLKWSVLEPRKALRTGSLPASSLKV
jgi:MFS family permease